MEKVRGGLCPAVAIEANDDDVDDGSHKLWSKVKASRKGENVF